MNLAGDRLAQFCGGLQKSKLYFIANRHKVPDNSLFIDFLISIAIDE